MRTTRLPGVGKRRPASSLSTCSLVVGPGLELEFSFVGESSDQEHVKIRQKTPIRWSLSLASKWTSRHHGAFRGVASD
ncbi:hypothetical protein LshimejAT787_1401050 [Lyophyllum shimeji]|uniref:Uncharacterized protein n=1 Tax=Lyophyllum shimeji TaxID=47721 RepID=A0A9P3PXW9_LYOSH|nr:hypothetical protein LshimejAT787_1401050 [Lyophyllum shimeji]